MKPVFQTKFGKDVGNCWSAVLASLLEMPLEDVPEFCIDYPETWREETNKWLVEKCGLYFLSLDPVSLKKLDIPIYGYHTIVGETKAGLIHAMIGYCGKLVHNPNPKEGSEVVKEMEYDFLIPIEPNLWMVAQHLRKLSRTSIIQGHL